MHTKLNIILTDGIHIALEVCISFHMLFTLSETIVSMQAVKQRERETRSVPNTVTNTGSVSMPPSAAELDALHL